MARTFHTLDVFTKTAFTGNPLAVVLDASELDAAQMQRIAREFNLSETVFVFPPDNPSHSAKMRIFTPGRELPFAGHPTVGTAILLATGNSGALDKEQDALLVLEQEIGPVRVAVRVKPGEAPFAEFDVPGLPHETGQVPPGDKIAPAIGLAPNEIGFENHVPVRYSAGVEYTFVPVRNMDVLARATPVTQYWGAAFGEGDHLNAFVYCRETVHRDATFHARMFAPMLGIPEDPATGSAAAALAGVIARFDNPPKGLHAGIIEQGYEMGRASEMHYELEVDGGSLKKVRIGGHAVRVSEGSIEA